MADRRTKKDRLKAKVRHRQTFSESPVSGGEKQVPAKTEPSKVKAYFFSQNPASIKADLKKTLIVTLFVFLVLFTIALLYT